MRDAAHAAVGRPFERAHFKVDLRALEGLVKAQADHRLIVAAGHRHVLRAGASAAVGAATASRQPGKEVGQVDVVEATLTLRVMLSPIGRWPEFLSRRVTAQLVVGCTLFRVLERFVGLAHFLELGLRILFLGHVGVILARQAAIGRLDVVRAGILAHAKNCVIILVLHASYPRRPSWRRTTVVLPAQVHYCK
jgi:hypothetical protein